MLHNGNYYNNYWPYNMYCKPAPFVHNTQAEPKNEENKKNETENIENNSSENYETINTDKEQKTRNKIFDGNKLSLFGFSLRIDDIIIIAIIIFLFMENKKDYLLIVILGLMLFDISTDTFKNMSIVKQLFNPT